MKRYPALFIKWLANRFGYKITLVKSGKGTTRVEGDMELLRYLDISGYFFKKEPFDRFKNGKQTPPPPPLNRKIYK
jgi:hypothetical protein